jgi:hypothetical protein
MRWLFAVALAIVPSVAGAQTKEQCIAAFDNGQDLREKLKLRAAKDQLLVCARNACAAPLRKDCAELLEAVMRDLPSVSFGARDPDGHDLEGFTAVIDGERIAMDESGRAVPVDPGPHDVRFEHRAYPPVVEHVVVRVGEHNRVIVASFRAAPPPPPPPPPPPTPQTPPPKDKSSAVSPVALVLLGVGAIGLGAFGFFAITGKNEKNKLLGDCAPACSDDQVSRVRTRYIAADVSLGVGLVALGAAVYLLVSNAQQPTQSYARSVWK